jgi:hypothetical protein
VKAAAKVSPRKVAQERFASLRKDEQQLVKQLMKFDAESIAFLSRIAAAL